MEMTLKETSEFLVVEDKNKDYPFSIEERQLAAKASSETWEAILNGTIEPFDFKK